jgi:hypothetical protein
MKDMKMIEFIAPTIFFASLGSFVYAVKDDALKAVSKAFGFKVVGVGFKKSHYTLSKAEALQWMGCYDEALLFKGKTFIGTRKAL